MTEQEYRLKYTSDNSDMLGKTNVLIRALRLMDSVADRLLGKLKTLFSGAGRSAGTAAPKIQAVAAAMTAVQTAAGATTPAVQSLATATKSVTSNTNRATTAAAGLSSGLGGLSRAVAPMVAIKALSQALAEALDDARKFAHECADEVLKLNDSVRELRMTRGEGVTTGEASAEVVDLMLRSEADQKDAVAFDTMWESTVFAAKKETPR